MYDRLAQNMHDLNKSTLNYIVNLWYTQLFRVRKKFMFNFNVYLPTYFKRR